MLRYLIVLMLCCTSWAEDVGTSSWRYGLGLGIEGRAQQNVNPDYPEMRRPILGFFQLQWSKWVLQFEVANERQKTSSSNLKVESSSLGLTAWGRYQFGNLHRWSPFVAFGGGVFLDRVSSSYQSEKEVRFGERGQFGLGGGLRYMFAKKWMTEIEGRVIGAQDRRDPSLSGLVRLGLLL